MEKVARLFRNGRNQAVRLPVEFEFDAKQVYVFKEANGDVTLSTRSRSQQNWQKVFELLPMLECDEHFLSEEERNQGIATRDPFEGF